MSFWAEDGGSPKMDDDRASVNSQLRKTKSMDASCLDMRTMNDISSPPHHPLTRAKSDFNLTASTQSLSQGDYIFFLDRGIKVEPINNDQHQLVEMMPMALGETFLI